MLTDLELAVACSGAYLPGATVEAGADLAATVRDMGGEVVVAVRGTANIAGWLRDIDAMPKSHDLLGYCHAGFLAGATQLWTRLQVHMPDRSPLTLTGHSLGGALALILAALRVSSGEGCARVVTFGAPRAGYARLAEVLRPIDIRQYCRGSDPVTHVPLSLPAFPYLHMREPLIAIGEGKWGSRPADHDIVGYIADLEAIARAEVARTGTPDYRG